MSNYKRRVTSPEVWAVIKARHSKDLVVFETYSSIGHMQTRYGFKGIPALSL
jgi:hypothetical protein